MQSLGISEYLIERRMTLDACPSDGSRR